MKGTPRDAALNGVAGQIAGYIEETWPGITQADVMAALTILLLNASRAAGVADGNLIAAMTAVAAANPPPRIQH